MAEGKRPFGRHNGSWQALAETVRDSGKAEYGNRWEVPKNDLFGD
jgi:hypothetical protein